MSKDFMNQIYEDGTVNSMEENCTSESIEPTNQKIFFYKCDICGQLVVSGVPLENPLSCCGQPMELLTPSTFDVGSEKHLPVFQRNEHKICVGIGNIPHPMTEEHHIMWVVLVTSHGIQWKTLSVNTSPYVSFRVKKCETVREIYSYCNIHGLWMMRP